MNEIILISIKDKFVDKILKGEKKFELRKTRPNIHENGILIIYTTNPVKKIIGHIIVSEVIREEIHELWNKNGSDFGTTLEDYLKYFCNKEFGYAIKIKKVINTTSLVDE